VHYLVGDIQGCAAALDELLATIQFSPSRDHLVVLGDLVNRGPDSLAVLERLHDLGNAATCLLGNHDLHLLAVAHGVRPPHRSDTLNDVLRSPRREKWLAWLRGLPLACRSEGWLCVHAGLVPQWSGDAALALAAEVEQVLQTTEFDGFVQHLYGNHPVRWSDALSGPDRWRFVINALTRLRFCTADGTMEFATKEGAHATPAGHYPWFDVPGRGSEGESIAFGHWSTLGLHDRPDLLGLDTGCVWGGELTAVRVDGGRREIVQVRCSPAQKPAA
jgi:bis(5'-nucleosyl)-tetraphosphatase (symmetrical)